MSSIVQGTVYCTAPECNKWQWQFSENQGTFKLQQKIQCGVDSGLKQLSVCKNFQAEEDFSMVMKMGWLFNDNGKTNFPSKSLFYI